ncbi:uncharacterized protein LOC122029182 [Zingiber officinale]|uniref:uncharacterized protein LOC122029182 n=1 Tax=Zingiber officinale TaxID=94328 RepID=UPI001C4D3A30|nr:uncharacterized protein LOC122029182 [Zingiber officinale]
MQEKSNLKNQIDEIPHSDDVDNLEDLEEHEEDDHQTKVKGKRPISNSSNHPTIQAKMCKNKGQFEENKKKVRDITVEKFARWIYDAGIPFNVVKYDSFEPCIEAIEQFGSGMKPPSYHEVRVMYLKELANTNSLLKSHEEDHAKFGCTIMADGWTDKKSRTLINFLVNGPKGSVFVESVDASGYSHIADKMFELLSKFVYRIGEKNMVQIVTNNASCNISAGHLLENRFPHLYWTPCVAHCLDLLLEDIFKIHLKKLHERALMVNGYIYNRPQVLSMMREFTGQRDMVKTAKTHFATAFLTLKRFHVQQPNLRKMFTSEKWANSRFSKEAIGKRVAEVILMHPFWKNMVFVLRVGDPLVKVLRLVDDEKRSPMGYIYESMDRAKEAITVSFNNNEEKYRSIFELIDKRWNIQLHRPLHAAGYFLSPECFYSNFDIENDTEVMEGLYKRIARLVRGEDLQDKITNQLEKYKKAEGLFGLPLAIRQRTLKSPEIDDSNEWLLGKLDDSDKDNDNDFVYEEEINLDDETEEEDTDGYKSSDGADDVDLDNEDEKDDYFDI